MPRSHTLATFPYARLESSGAHESHFLMDPDAAPGAVQFDIEDRDSSVGALQKQEAKGSTARQHSPAATERLPEPPVIWIPTPKPALDYLLALQKWEGIVLSRGPDSFHARLIDQNRVGPDEEAEVLLDEVSRDDLPLVTPGAVFYWSIGYHVGTNRQKRRVSVIRFRRLPTWTHKELEQANQQAENLWNLLEWNQ
jgi:hypothetical protein